MKKPLIEMDLREFKRTATKFARSDYPEVVAKFAQILALGVQKVEQRELPKDLNVKSGWIAKNINAFPKTKGQTNKIKSDVKKSHGFVASVSGSERIPFMTSHNEGMKRVTQSDWQFGPDTINNSMAIPMFDLKDRSYRTKSGMVKDKYYPLEMLKDWKGSKGKRPGKRQKKPFLMKLPKSGKMAIVVRKKVRKPKGIKLLWTFSDSARIKKDWNFDETGQRAITNKYQRAFKAAWKGLK